MELTFTKIHNAYVAEFNAEGHFNIHIEDGGVINIFRNNAHLHYTNVGVVDNDFGFNIYPKTIKVECSKEPSVAVVTYNE